MSDEKKLALDKTEEAIRRVLNGTNRGFVLVGFIETKGEKTQYALFGSEMTAPQIALGVIEGTYANLAEHVKQHEAMIKNEAK